MSLRSICADLKIADAWTLNRTDNSRGAFGRSASDCPGELV
jgi:hypothetical protein